MALPKYLKCEDLNFILFVSKVIKVSNYNNLAAEINTFTALLKTVFVLDDFHSICDVYAFSKHFQ